MTTGNATGTLAGKCPNIMMALLDDMGYSDPRRFGGDIEKDTTRRRSAWIPGRSPRALVADASSLPAAGRPSQLPSRQRHVFNIPEPKADFYNRKDPSIMPERGRLVKN